MPVPKPAKQNGCQLATMALMPFPPTFPSAKPLLVGRRLPQRSSKGNRHMRRILNQAANAAINTKVVSSRLQMRLRRHYVGLRIRWLDPITQNSELPDHFGHAPLFRSATRIDRTRSPTLKLNCAAAHFSLKGAVNKNGTF